jgi:hypothetical protein
MRWDFFGPRLSRQEVPGAHAFAQACYSRNEKKAGKNGRQQDQTHQIECDSVY